MPQIAAFRALRYDPAAGDLSSCLCPPYDVISPAERAVLAARSPANAAHLVLPEGEGAARYERASAELERMISGRILRLDDRPRLYAMRESWASEGAPLTRTGVFARLRLEEFGSGVMPHEQTFAGPREDRMRLLRACRANLSAIMAVVPDPDGAFLAAAKRIAVEEPVAEGALDGTSLAVGATSDPATIEAARAAVAAGAVMIADGHHRYESALARSRELAATDTELPGAAWILAYLVSAVDPGLRVFATHRALRRPGGISMADLRAALGGAGIEELGGDPPAAVERRLADGQVGISAEGCGIIVEPAEGELGVDLAARLLAALGDELDVSFVRQGGLGELPEGSWDALVLLAEPEISAIVAAAAGGRRLPQKSTYFHPKVPTGLVFSPHWL